VKGFERIINLMGFEPGPSSSTLDQHCSAMRMDSAWGWTFNQLNYAITDVKKDIARLDAEFGKEE
jgi:hypothetical protein